MPLSRYLKVYPSGAEPNRFVAFSTVRSSAVILDAGTLQAAEDGTLAGPERETLSRLGMFVEDLGRERELMASMLDRMAERNRRFRGTVVLNLDCNLDCGYCYERQFRGGMYMTDSTAEQLVEFLKGSFISRGKDVSLTFYGGEPLLSQDLIRKISIPLLEAAKSHEVEYSFGLVTNGTLLSRDVAEGLIPFGLKHAKFTLDGPREIHDRQRPYTSGAGSFDAVVENMAAVCDLLQIHLGGNFYENNYREFPRLLDYLLESGLTPAKLALVHFTPITPEAGCAEASSGCTSSTEPWLTEAFPFLREEIMRRGFATQRIAASACIVEFPDILVISYDGTLYKCPAFMGQKSLSVGNVADGIGDYSNSHCVGNWKKEECLDCAYLPLCFGGCRFLTQLQGKPLSEVECKRDFLDATLEQMVVQQLTYRTAAQPPSPSK
jgi:uncharacterized protein